MRAMILAAGYGTRLFPLTADRAKPALPFLGQPLVGYVAKYLSTYGVRDVLVNLHHKSDSVRRALGDGSRFGVRAHFINEPEILGTSGALDNARELLSDDTFIVINGKIITDINLSAALETHRRHNALATLILRRNERRERFSVVHAKDELISSFGGMPIAVNESDNASGMSELASPITSKTPLTTLPLTSTSNAPLMFTGIQILEPRIFDYIPRQQFSHSTTDVYPNAIRNGERVVAHVAEGDWYELSTPQRYLDISLEVWNKAWRKRHPIGGDKPFVKYRESLDDVFQSGQINSVFIEQSSPIKESSKIEEGARVNDSVIWERVRIEAGAVVRRSIIGDDVHIKTGERFINKIVVRAGLVRDVEISEKALRGEFAGDNFVVPLPE